MTSRLSSSQQGIYLECIAYPESTLYNLPFLGHVHGETDPEQLKKALLKAIAAHPALNAVLTEDGEGNICLKTDDTPPEIPVCTLSDEEFAQRKGALVRPFDLNGGKLARFEIYCTPSGLYLFEDIHHLVFDGTSGRILEQDVGAALDGGEPEKEQRSLFELAEIEEEWLQTEEAGEALAYWKGILTGCESGCEPERDRWEDQKSQGWLTRCAELDENAFSALRHRAGCSTSAFFTAAFGYLVSVFTGQEDVLFNTIAAGRDETTARTVGMLVRTLPVRMELKEESRIDDFLKHVNTRQEESRRHARYPYLKLAEAFDLKPRIMFGYHGKLTREVLISGREVDVERIYDEAHIEAVPVLFEVSQAAPGQYRIHVGYRSDRYSREWAESFTETYLRIIREMFEKETLQEIELVSEAYSQRLEGFNHTEKAIGETDIVTLFRRSAAQHPERTAVICGEKRLSYRELDILSDRIAAYARKNGIGPEDVVSILIPRSEYMAAAALGALKAGAAYQPLDPSYPPERLQYMVKDAEAKLLIADESLTGLLPDYDGPVLLLKEIPALPEDVAPETGLTPDNLFILLYTSGTTGQPKGVMLTHRNLVNFCDWYRTYYSLTPESVVAAYASFGFDAHMMDLYPALTTGAAVCIVPEDVRMDLMLLNRYYEDHGVTHVFMTTQMGRMFAATMAESSLKCLTTGGERLVPIEPPKGYRFFNGYGPTECTIFTTTQEVDRLYGRVPIGLPLTNTRLYVTDRQGRLLPAGAAGELWIAGFGVGRGYLNLPEKTAETFIPNPFCSEPGYDRIYRTGDIVCRLGDGRIDFIGRNDGQVKVRGFRIELAEVEGVIREYPGIRDVTVQAFADEKTGMKYLAAYVVCDTPVDVSALNAFIRERKPPYMVPAATIRLDAIPLNQNQKVDRRALPLPRRENAEHEAPETEEERLTFECAAEAMGHRDFGVLTDLEEAGMTSLGAMQLNVLLGKAFRRTVRTREMKALHTVREIAAYLSRASKEHEYAVQESYPLSGVQEGICAECMADPESTAYNIHYLLKADPSVEADRLKAALAKTIGAHPFLKARLEAGDDGKIIIRRNDDAVIDIETVEKSALPDGFAGLVRPFRLTEEPLIRTALIRDGKDLYLFLDVHHIIFDGESLGLFMRDLETAYAGGALEKEAFTVYEAILDEMQQRDGPAYGEAKAYYANLLEGVDTDCLPVPDGNGSEKEAGLLSHMIKADREETERFLREGKTTVNALMNAAFGVTLARFLGRNDCVYTTVYNGRNDSRLAGSVGMFVHTLPVVCRTAAGETGRDFVSRLGRQLSDSMANDIFSFGEIAHTFDVKSDILLVYEGTIATSFTLGGKPAEHVQVQPEAVKAPLAFIISDTEDGFRIDCEYEAQCYEEWNIRSMLESMETAMRALLRNEAPEQISLLTEERQAELRRFNETEKPVENTDVVTLFRRAAAQEPGRTALICGEKRMTYQELDRISDRIAAYARGIGIGPEDVISILIPRSEYMAVTALGALKAGAAYQPLDPSYPPDRLQYMVKDAEAKMLIADESLTGLLPDYKGPVLLLKDIPELPDSAAPAPGPAPENLFILLYTSGTTGKPKGVMLTHRNFVNLCLWYRGYYSLTPESVVAAYASFGFDANAFDLWPALTTGATVCVVPEELRMDLMLLNRYYEENGVTHVFMTTQMGRMYATQFPDSGIIHMTVGGEKLVPVEPPKGYTLVNGYGPSECTCMTTGQKVDRLYDRIPIGCPIDNAKVYVVDAQGRELPAGATGELWIAGYGVGRGYLHLPEKTAQVFISNPFCTEPGFDRVYRTGDVVRRLGDGRIDFIGRNDGQVKVRGFRIELSEVEGVIREYPGIADATVQAFADERTGMKYLAAYVVSDETVDVQALNAFIREKKPSYMVPSVTMQLDRIPLTQNQKVDRRALPQPRRETAALEPPATEEERLAFDCAAEALGHRDFGVETDLEEAGLTSLGAMQLNILLGKAFRRTVRTREMKALRTVREVAAYFREHSGTDASEGRGWAVQKTYPLSGVQQGIYVECLANPNSTAYNLPILLKLDPSVDPDRLKEALTKTIDAHPFLKARFETGKNGEIMMRRNDDAVIEIGMTEKDELPLGFAGLIYPFRLMQDPMIRVSLIRDGAACYLFMDVHHIVFDGESVGIFMRDLEKAYAGGTPEKELFTGYEAALDEVQLRGSTAYEEAKAYYAGLLEGLDPDCLPVRDRNEPVAEAGLLSREVAVDRAETERFLREGKTTVNALMNAAFGLMLARFLGRNDCVYTTVYNGRNDSRLADSVGMFVHTLPVVCRLTGGESGREFVSRLGHQLSDSMANDIFSFAEISRTFDVKANVLFVYEGTIGTAFTVGGKPAESVATRPEAVKAALTFFVYDTENGFRLSCEYETEHYEEWDILSMLSGMEAALKALLRNEHPDRISLLTEEGKAALIRFNATEKPVEETDIVTLFRRAAARDPGRTAVICGENRMTYRELDDLSDRIAAYAGSLGIGPEDVISILIPRSEYMAVTALGALKAGAAYQPLDSSYPPERLRYMVEDAGAKLLITDEKLAELLPDYQGPVLLLKDIPALPDQGAPASGLTPDNLFILLYTSGTTGQPKGVMLTHRNLVNFCDWYRTYYGLTPESTVAAYASFGFDADMMDLYPALTTGAAVCIVPEDLRLDLVLLNRYYQENGVTHVFMTTQMGRMFAAQFPDSGIAHLSLGGEKLVPVAPPKGYTLTNAYGPTECTIFTTTQEVDRLYDRVPIGLPLSNYKTYVVDGQGHELPPGAMGELWIAGFGVGRGYLHLPEKSAQVFTPNPFCTAPGFDRVYHTGDVVRRLEDGRIDFIGRSDGQVKIRGFRIELAEVEGVIRDYPGIRDVTVQAFEDEAAGGKYIAAYVVADTPVDFDRLGDYIRDRKPPYMVPAAFMQLDVIPLNQNQKVNKRALPKPDRREANKEYVEPATPLERELCEEYAAILGLEKVSATDSFFDIGGSSISAAQVIMFAMNKGYSIVYKDVFANPSPRELARVIAGMAEDDRSGAAADFDYTAINKLIAFNAMEHVDEIAAVHPLGNVILTGATGFLGIHVLKALLDKTEGKITCLMRRGRYETAERRMKEMLMYYFGEMKAELFGTRVFCAEGDITDPESLKCLDGLDATMVINCAASVKHFTNDDLLDRVNFHGVENLVEVCLRNGMRLVHVSTLSVGGEMEAEHLTELKENMLYFGQNVRNDYVRTKFLAERAILDARVKHGLDAVILRAGNLMGRHTDGEFQINFETNAFMRSLWAYVKLRQCPFSILEKPVEFSPIDSVADAVLKLAGVDSRFSVFHMNNNHCVTIADLMDAIRRHGFEVQTVPDEQFRETLAEAAKHEDESRTVLSLVAYSNQEGDTLQMVDSDRRFTVNALFRLGFRWPIVDDDYLEKIIWALDSLSFFTDLD